MAKKSDVNADTYQIEHIEPVLLLGFHDEYLDQLSEAYPDTKLTVRGSKIKIAGSEKAQREIKAILGELEKMADRNGKITKSDIKTVLALKKSGDSSREKKTNPLRDAKVSGDFIVNKYNGEAVTAKTKGQKKIVRSSARNDIVFTIGPAGTGKTYTSVALAVKALKERRVNKIILTRPAVEAGETLGFLPGDLREKIDPYLRPLYDALEDMIDYERLELHISKHNIEIAPLAYMRGRTLNNAFVILDEAQNATNKQMKMFLTRIGFNSRAIITGDVTQTDLPRKKQSGLISIQKILKDIEGISFVYLDEDDVVRHRLVREIIQAYEQHEHN